MDARSGGFQRHWREIATGFLKFGATSYGGAATWGLMQAELQEKRQWLTRERFLEGLSLVNLLPGPTATQLGIFLGYMRGGWWGGLLAGTCFVLPSFCVMLALAMAYASLEATSVMRGGLSGLGPVVLGIYIVAVYRLGRSVATSRPQVITALSAALAAAVTPLGVAAILALAAGIGIARAYSPRAGGLTLAVVAACIAVMYVSGWSPLALVSPHADAGVAQPAPTLAELAIFFLGAGTVMYGGGLTLLTSIQDQMVNQFHWITAQEFLDGLALGQLTPGPVVVVATYVGYKVAGTPGAVVSAFTVFLPSFALMLLMLPLYARMRGLVWMEAAMQGLRPAVIGVLAVSLVRLAPHALPDPFAVAILAGTLVALLGPRIGALKLMLAGGALGVVRNRFMPLAGVRLPLP